MFNFLRRKHPEHRADVSELYARAVFDAVSGQKHGVRSTSAANAAAGLVGRAFSIAEVNMGFDSALTPEWLGMVGRELILAGEVVCDVVIDDGIRLVPASQWDIQGMGDDPDGWQYTLTIPSPGRSKVVRRTGSAVVHLRHSVMPSRPWRGLGPLDVAVLDGTLLANITEALRDEAGSPRGAFLPIPVKDGDDETLAGWRDRIGRAAGRIMAVESMATNWQAGGIPPRRDYETVRFGFDAPATATVLMKAASDAVYAVCGIPKGLVDGSGTGAREGYRQLLFGTVSPLGKLVAAELSRKLETDITLDWTELRAGDIAGRARAFQSLINGGMDITQAAALSGLMMPGSE